MPQITAREQDWLDLPAVPCGSDRMKVRAVFGFWKVKKER
jgi:hypothetical protein